MESRYDRTDCDWRTRTDQNSKKDNWQNWRLSREQYSKKDTRQNSVKRKRPTHFLAIQINNPKVIEGLKKVQDHILNDEPKLQPAMASLKKSHVTLLVFHVEDDTELLKAKETLEETMPKLRNVIENGIHLNVCKVSSFNNKVVFAGIREDKEKNKLLDMTELLMTSFESRGFDVREDRPFNPHLTIFKMSKAPQLFRMGIKKVEPHLYEEYCNAEFGTENVKSIQLLSMNKEENGYYQCVTELLLP